MVLIFCLSSSIVGIEITVIGATKLQRRTASVVEVPLSMQEEWATRI